MAIRETDKLGTLVKRYRTALGLTQEELAERAGVSARSISDLERGLERTPYPGTIRRLADALELDDEQRAAFMAARARPRDEGEVPVARKPRPGWRTILGWLPRRFVAALLTAALVVAGAIVLVARGSGATPAQARVYSTSRAPVLLDSWSTSLKHLAAFGPNIVDIAVGPPGYEYAVSAPPGYGTDTSTFYPVNAALRFSTTGRALDAWPVSDVTAAVGGAAVDAHGDLWVTTSDGVREFSPDGRQLGSWSSQGFNPGQVAGPAGIAIASNGDVIVGEGDSHRVQVFTPGMKLVRQWSGSGASTQSFVPSVIASDAQGDMYILDYGSWQIEKYTLQGKLLSVWRPPGLLRIPKRAANGADLTVDGDGNVYAVISAGSTLDIEKLSSNGREVARWSSVGPHGEVSSGVDGLRFAGKVGYLGVTDGRVLKVDQRMHVLASWTLQQLRRPLFHSPAAMVAGTSGDVYVTDAGTHLVIKLSTESGDVALWPAPIASTSTGPFVSAIAVTPKGSVAVVNAAGTGIDTVSPGGTRIRLRGQARGSAPYLRAYTSLGIDGNGNVSVLTYPDPMVKTFSPSGRLIQSWCAVCDIPGVNTPATMTVSAAGDIYVAAPSQIVEFTPTGVPIRSWNAQTISRLGPVMDIAGMDVDRQGNLYVSDLDNNALEVFSPSGRTLASWTRIGPDGPALSDLGPVTVDAQGNIFLINGKSLLELAPLRVPNA